MPRLISHHTSRRQARTPRRGLNRPACARPVAVTAALWCAQQVYLVSRLVTTGWAVLASSQPRDFARGDARLSRDICQMRQSDMRATAKASDGMLIPGVPLRGCRSPLPLGPTFAFQIGLGLANRRRREGHAADLSNSTRRDFSSAMAGSQQACPSHGRPCPTASPVS
jgi:hypothetical protein